MMQSAFDPGEQDLAALAAALAQGRASSAGLVDAYLARIAAFDRAGPALHAMIALDPGAGAEAARCDDERRRGICRGPLHGLPMVVKDNIDVAGLATTAGSVLWREHLAPRDAAVVAALRAAGAIVLGKTNMSEFACSSGWYGYSSLGGLTLNPYNLARNAAGSSSGSAAAVAAGYAAFGLGTDTFGSIRAPACVTGLVGVRPTPGLCPAGGILPLAPGFDVVGPMARCVRDAALVLQAMAVGAGAAPAGRSAVAADYGPSGTRRDGPSMGDSGARRTQHRDGAPKACYAEALTGTALRGARLGVAREFPGEGEVHGIFQAACAVIAAEGGELVPVTLPQGAASVHADFLGPLADAQWDAALEAYFADRPGNWPRTLAQLAAAAAMSASGTAATRPINPRTVAFLHRALAQPRAMTPARRAALQGRQARFREALAQLLRRERLDAIIYPSLLCPASPRYDMSDPTYACAASNAYLPLYVASAAGMPDVTVPAGMADAGVPVGMSFMGRPFGEAALLSLAYAFEQATHARMPPGLPGDIHYRAAGQEQVIHARAVRHGGPPVI
jgi:amidase